MRPRPDEVIEEAMIVAIARVHDLTVVTRNVRDVKPLGVNTLNPCAVRPNRRR